MTAAIPPACCAGVDDGKIRSWFCRVGRAHGGNFACADRGTNRSGIRADADANSHTNSEPLTYADPNAFAQSDTNPHANRRGFQRGLDR